MGLKSMGKGLQEKLGALFSRLPLTPNQITFSALLFALIGLYFAFLSQPLPSLLFFILSGAADAIDGAVARVRKASTAHGAYIDGMIDRLVEFCLVCSFFFFALPVFIIPSALSLLLILFFGSCMTSFATAYADHRKVASAQKIASQPGILARAERLILLFSSLALVPFCPYCSSALLCICAALCLITFFQRFMYFAR